MQWLKTNRADKDEKRLPGLHYTPKQLFFVNNAIVSIFLPFQKKEEH
jgi:hypothetical protein